ncbi:MAG: c-type cytochrome [Pseudomonadota bacterium]|nr:c-type cytochrome [Pseudomonadota bacterium]
MRRLIHPALALAACLLAFAGCSESGGDGAVSDRKDQAARGAELIAAKGCGTCHEIPGIDGATGRVGPPLDHMGDRMFIAGMIRNTAENMQVWLTDPQSVVPGNAMPDTGLEADEAEDVAAYLDSLR